MEVSSAADSTSISLVLGCTTRTYEKARVDLESSARRPAGALSVRRAMTILYVVLPDCCLVGVVSVKPHHNCI
jgi:hypothetical protein